MKKFLFLLQLLAAIYGVQAQTSPAAASAAQAHSERYTVYAIRFASAAHPFPISDWADKGPKTDSVSIDFMVWLVKGAGKNILVDAGFLKDIPEGKDFEIVNYTRPDSALAKVTLKPEDITDIILTHPHWDHIDGIGLFPKAHIWIQKDDYGYFVGAARQIPGIKVFTGSRHTFNSQYVLVETGKQNTILASDNIWIYYSLDHMTPASQGGTLDPAGYVKAMQRMTTMVSDKKYIIPGHDAQIFSRFPTVANGVVQIE